MINRLASAHARGTFKVTLAARFTWQTWTWFTDRQRELACSGPSLFGHLVDALPAAIAAGQVDVLPLDQEVAHREQFAVCHTLASWLTVHARRLRVTRDVFAGMAIEAWRRAELAGQVNSAELLAATRRAYDERINGVPAADDADYIPLRAKEVWIKKTRRALRISVAESLEYINGGTEPMSKGNPIVSGRITPEELAALKDFCERSAHTRSDEPLDVSKFVAAAIREKLAHITRSRKPRRRPK